MTPKRLLIVDDEAELAEVTAELLRGDLLHVDIATTPARALDLSVSNHYDALLSDVIMPGMTGPKLVAEWIRRHGAAPPVIFATGNPDGESPAIPGAVILAYLSKPIAPDDVERILARHFGTT